VHYLRQQDLNDGRGRPYTGPAEERYREFEARFEERNGPIVSSYWCTTAPSGVALTLKRRPGILADVVRLHWATDWAAKENPKLMGLLYRAESLSVRVHEVLRDTSQRLAMQSLFTVISFLLGFSESERAKDERAVSEVCRTAREHLKRIETYYEHAAKRSGQIVYVAGMLLGMVPVAALLLLALVLKLLDSTNVSARTALFCFAAGSVGALVSVMSRLSSNRVQVDWEFGKDTLRTLGSLRPFVGGIFGLMTFFALKSGVVALEVGNSSKSNYFYVLFSFAAGFSERLAQDMLLGSTMQTAVSRKGDPAKPEGAETDGLPEAAPTLSKG